MVCVTLECKCTIETPFVNAANVLCVWPALTGARQPNVQAMRPQTKEPKTRQVVHRRICFQVIGTTNRKDAVRCASFNGNDAHTHTQLECIDLDRMYRTEFVRSGLPYEHATRMVNEPLLHNCMNKSFVGEISFAARSWLRWMLFFARSSCHS